MEPPISDEINVRLRPPPSSLNLSPPILPLHKTHLAQMGHHNQPAELRVFISSTFRDLQEEREHLIKKIFPEIRALCRERGITFTEVDLRWGLTHNEGTYGRILRTCLEEID